MQTRLSLRYTGPAVDAGMMDVYEAAANMVAFSEFIVAAAKVTFGEKAEARAEVAGLGRGSFVTDLVISFGGPLATLFSSPPAASRTCWASSARRSSCGNTWPVRRRRKWKAPRTTRSR